MVIVMKVGSSTYTALAGMHKGTNNTRKQTADLAGATQMKSQVKQTDITSDLKTEKAEYENAVDSNQKSNKTIGSIIDVKV